MSFSKSTRRLLWRILIRPLFEIGRRNCALQTFATLNKAKIYNTRKTSTAGSELMISVSRLTNRSTLPPVKKLQNFQLHTTFWIQLKQEAQSQCAVAVPPMWHNKNWSNIQQITSTNNQKLTNNISIETVSKEIMPTALETYGFENRHNKIINWTFSHVQSINIPI